ncbi:MAG TPA: hypothetical protein VFN09_04480 [Rhodanobacteraceae bacterium]|nr:hypothetical protein [Rhodanobacteraceae bacterium]
MKSTLWLSLALAALALPAAHAQSLVQRDRGAIDSGHLAQIEISRHARSGHHGDRVAYALGQGFGGENGPYANPYRTYPPSCMADPLPTTPTGPTWGQDLDVAAYVPALRGYVREKVNITLWRVACSSDLKPSAITLLRLTRLGNYEGNTAQYVAFPGLSIAQGTINFGDSRGFDLPRVAVEPNTIIAQTQLDSTLVNSTTYVLEDYPLSDRPAFDYSQPFAIRVDNYINDGKTRQYTINVPAYSPTQSSYPAAYQPMRVSGYMTNNWYDRSHSGEGMMVQVYEQQSAGKMVLQFNWFTYGPDGLPFWISGDGQFSPGAQQVTVPMAGYRDGGGFAGNFGTTTAHAWGTVTFQFSDCNHMTFTYQANNGLPSYVPQGTGTRTWTRLASANGMTCE